MLKTSQTLSQTLLGTATSAPIELHNQLQRDPDEYDRDFVQQHGEDPDTTLTSVGEFPASA